MTLGAEKSGHMAEGAETMACPACQSCATANQVQEGGLGLSTAVVILLYCIFMGCVSLNGKKNNAPFICSFILKQDSNKNK